jgi:hypothetical protein
MALFTTIIIYFFHNYHKYSPYSVELVAICNLIFQLAKPLTNWEVYCLHGVIIANIQLSVATSLLLAPGYDELRDHDGNKEENKSLFHPHRFVLRSSSVRMHTAFYPSWSLYYITANHLSRWLSQSFNNFRYDHIMWGLFCHVFSCWQGGYG